MTQQVKQSTHDISQPFTDKTETAGETLCETNIKRNNQNRYRSIFLFLILPKRRMHKIPPIKPDGPSNAGVAPAGPAVFFFNKKKEKERSRRSAPCCFIIKSDDWRRDIYYSLLFQ